jgi:hypothetical protein
MERFLSALSLTVLLVGLSAVAQVQPPNQATLGFKKNLPSLTPTADLPLSRAELAKILTQRFDLRVQSAIVAIPDLDKSHPAYTQIQAVLSHGLMTRDAEGQFYPDHLVPRAEALTIVAKAQGAKPLPEATVNQILSRYPYAQQIPMAARGAIATSLQNGWIPLKAGKIAPLSPITHREIGQALGIYLGARL